MTQEEINKAIEEKAKALFDAGKADTLKEAQSKAKELVETELKESKDSIELVKKEFEQKLEEQKTAIQKSFEVKLDEKDKKIDEALTQMNRLKEKQRESQVKTLQHEIYEALGDHVEKMASWSHNKKEFTVEMKDVAPMGVVAGSVAPQFVAPVGVPHEMAHLRNVIPVSPTSSNLIKYIRFTRKDGSIAPTAPGAEKPAIDYNQTVEEAPVRKIAGHVDVYDEFLDDVEGARDFLATELPQAYLDVEDQQLLKGDGLGQNISGLWGAAQDLILPKGTVTSASNSWDKIAAGLAQIRRNLRAGSAVWISPEDYMELLINKGNTDEYTYPIVADTNGQLRIGGVPIFQHAVFAAGEGLAGDYVRGARIFQKKGMSVRFSTENKDNFVKNVTTVLVEARIALAIYFPESFIKFDFGTATPTT